jgi:phosphoribosylpyrophosphate synthetase
VDKACAILGKYEFDAIAFRGMSGAIPSPVIALAMNKTMIMVRKPESESHSGRNVEGDRAARRYVIVDDFIESGATVQAIYDQVKEFTDWYRLGEHAVCIGVLCLNEMNSSPRLVPVPERECECGED